MGGLVEEGDTQAQGKRKKETELGRDEKTTAEKTCPLCFHLSLCSLFISQGESGSKSPAFQSAWPWKG